MGTMLVGVGEVGAKWQEAAFLLVAATSWP